VGIEPALRVSLAAGSKMISVCSPLARVNVSVNPKSASAAAAS
jgi:hypothetical protein